MSSPAVCSIEDQASGYQHGGNESSGKDFRLSKIHSLFKRYFETILIICGWDLFAVYKHNHGHANRCRTHRSLMLPELRLGQNSFDKWRKRLRAPVLILMGYLVVKLTIIGLVKVADKILLEVYIFDSDRPRNLSSSSRARLDAYLSPNPLRNIMPTHYQTTIERVVKFGRTAKEPYYSITTATDLWDLLIALSLCLFVFVVPPFFKKNPLDASIQRFMLDPVREISRIDFVIKQQLNLLLQESPKSQAIKGQLQQVASLRPHVFTANWHHLLYSYSLFTTLIVGTEVLSALGTFNYIVYRIVKKNLCIIDGIEDCRFWAVFTTNDALYIAELMIAVIGGVLSFTFLAMVITLINTVTQLAMIQTTRAELNRCLSMLRSSNMRSLDLYSLNYDRRQSSSRHRASLVSRLFDSRCLLGNSSKEQEIELCLLRTYLKLVVTFCEATQIAHSVGRMVEINLANIGFVVIALFINFIHNDFKVPITQLYLFVCCFILSNPFMLICSYAFARTVELEKIAWSILTELATYQDLTMRRGNPRSCKSGEHIEALAERWRRLVQSYALSSRRNASQPFGLSMDYGEVINIDFFVISIGLVLMTH